MINKQRAMLSPESVFKDPMEVVREPSLTVSEKIDLLHRWAYDINELAVAEEENMPARPNNGEGQRTVSLQQVYKALAELGDEGDEDIGHITKHGE